MVPLSNRWLANRERWMFGKFSDLDSESIERDVDAYANTISKAVKFFEREEKGAQAGERRPPRQPPPRE